MFEIQRINLAKFVDKLNEQKIVHDVDINNPLKGKVTLPRNDGGNDYCHLNESFHAEGEIKLSLSAGAKTFKHFDKLHTGPTAENQKLLRSLIEAL